MEDLHEHKWNLIPPEYKCCKCSYCNIIIEEYIIMYWPLQIKKCITIEEKIIKDILE
jgi:hypothetical protein